ncbi:hypothetical protein CERZMDRAFT_43304 [Cercospora zeae-maydis SCOH1-5]|uniref:FAD-binding domain-containing protein n=1 Tax=Cercospora zeae-maydis SCOH1-5 TaxID=717836 RepID=A0A6A6FDT2_9PEZI|nr:hypothetical protein CERZMDRAFT_43304 [Cercospora zeae-maydis SCOH1-5]
MAASKRRVLVNGGGPAGAATAFWLAKAGFDVLVTERSTTRPYGQGVDVTGRAVDILGKMGLEQRIRDNTTGEEGLVVVDDHGENVAPPLGAAPAEGGTASVTQEIEIMRRDLTRIFVEAAEALPSVTFRYGCTVDELHQHENSITAVLSDTREPEEFAGVIGADGLGSTIRKLAFEQRKSARLREGSSLHYCRYDTPVGKLQHANKGRGILIRPIDKKGNRSSCYLMSWTEDHDLAQVARTGSQEDQKALLDNMFRGFNGPLGKRAVEGMHRADDFYFTRIVQIKLDSWHRGRAALVGDAAYSPSPLTGQGTTLAIIGAYVLAGEMAKSPDDLQQAFASYHAILKAFVSESQQIPLGGKAPKLALPQTDWGIWILRLCYKIIALSGLWRLLNFGNETVKVDLPEYDFGPN